MARLSVKFRLTATTSFLAATESNAGLIPILSSDLEDPDLQLTTTKQLQNSAKTQNESLYIIKVLSDKYLTLR
ncbi:MAG: hypothetical protein NVSMB24_08000 [Mucilaginibacter sp.]